MKTINYVFIFTIFLFSSSCSYEDLWQSDTEDDSDEEQVIYLELDLHQLALEAEEKRLFREHQIIFEEFMNGDEEQEVELKKSKHNLLINLDTFLENEEFLRGIGPRRPPGKPCGSEGPDAFAFMTEFGQNTEEYLSNPSAVYIDPDYLNCPIRMPENVKILVHENQNEVKGVKFITSEEGVCGEMAGMEPTGEEGFQEVIMERNGGCGDYMKVNKRSRNGELISYSLPIKN